jgi:hypothetical protein
MYNHSCLAQVCCQCLSPHVLSSLLQENMDKLGVSRAWQSLYTSHHHKNYRTDILELEYIYIYIYIWCPEFEITYFILVKSVRFLKSPCKRHALQWYVLEPFIQASRQNPSFCWSFNYSWISYLQHLICVNKYVLWFGIAVHKFM